MSVASWSGSLLAWKDELSALKARLGRLFGRRELRGTGWLMAEQAGAERPYRIQSLLSRSRWDANALMGDVRLYVAEAFNPDGVLVVNETGFLKKGRTTHTASSACRAPCGDEDNPCCTSTRMPAPRRPSAPRSPAPPSPAAPWRRATPWRRGAALRHQRRDRAQMAQARRRGLPGPLGPPAPAAVQGERGGARRGLRLAPGQQLPARRPRLRGQPPPAAPQP